MLCLHRFHCCTLSTVMPPVHWPGHLCVLITSPLLTSTGFLSYSITSVVPKSVPEESSARPSDLAALIP